MMTKLMKALEQAHPEAFVSNAYRTLAIFGFDFLVDAKGRIWLLEANHGPCFPTSENHPLTNYLYDDFWKAFINEFVLPIAVNQEQKSID